MGMVLICDGLGDGDGFGGEGEVLHGDGQQ